MGHLVSRHRLSDGSGEERRDVEDDRQVGRQAPQRADCSVQGPCPLHPPAPPLRPVQPLLVSALRGSVPCLPTSHLHPGPFYPSGYLGMIESDAGFLGNGSLQPHQYWLPTGSTNYCQNTKSLKPLLTFKFHFLEMTANPPISLPHRHILFHDKKFLTKKKPNPSLLRP